MPKFEFLNHPIDLKIKAYGKDLPSLFKNAALGMMTYLYPRHVDIEEHETKAKIRLKAKDEKELLIDWLEEILELSNEKDVCYNDFDIKKLNEEELTATIWGRRVKSKENIKSIIKSETDLIQELEGYSIIIIFDL